MKKCEFCGQMIPDESIYCPKCGCKSVSNDVERDLEQASDDQKERDLRSRELELQEREHQISKKEKEKEVDKKEFNKIRLVVIISACAFFIIVAAIGLIILLVDFLQGI